MALFGIDEWAGRFIRLVPRTWFSDVARKIGGRFYALMAGFGEGAAFIYQAIQTLRANSRLLTTQDIAVLTLFSRDFFGGTLPFLAGETPDQYRRRILARMFLPGGTREGIRRSVYNLTGLSPVLIEPWNPNDCGAWDVGPWGYDVAGAWGDPTLPWTGFARIQRPTSVASNGQPYAYAYDAGYAGYDTPLGDFADLQPLSTIPDSQLYAAVDGAKAIGTTVWVQLQ
jgi:hypothetical protein